MGASLSRVARQLRRKPRYVRNGMVAVLTVAWLLHYGLWQVARPQLFYQQLQAENWKRDRKRAARLVRSCRVLATRFWPLLFILNGGVVMSMAAGSAWIRKKPPVFSHKVVIRTRDGGSLTINIAPAAPATSSVSAFTRAAIRAASTASAGPTEQQHASTHEECHWHTIIPDTEEEKSPSGEDESSPVESPVVAPPPSRLRTYSSSDWLSATTASLARSASVPHLAGGRSNSSNRLVSSTSMTSLSDAASPTATALGSGSPVLVMFPGNLGGMGSAYLFAAARLAHEKGWTAIIYERRGCGLNALTSPLTQNYADEDDVRLVMAKIKSMYPDSPLLAIGYSLGGNYLTRYIGSCGLRGEPPPFVAACVVANPFNLVGLSYVLKYKQKLSQWALLGDLRRVIRHNMHILNKHPEHKIDATELINMASYRQVVTTCELKFWGSRHNAKCLDEYLLAGSSAYMLEHVQLPLLCITADDDPVSIPGLIPYEVFAKNPYLCLAKTRKGGHIGYVGLNPFGDNWSERASMEWLEVALLASS